jgi:hypothetical protein
MCVLPFFGAGDHLRKTLVEEDDRCSRHLQFLQEHHPVFVKMRDEPFAVVLIFVISVVNASAVTPSVV